MSFLSFKTKSDCSYIIGLPRNWSWLPEVWTCVAWVPGPTGPVLTFCSPTMESSSDPFLPSVYGYSLNMHCSETPSLSRTSLYSQRESSSLRRFHWIYHRLLCLGGTLFRQIIDPNPWKMHTWTFRICTQKLIHGLTYFSLWSVPHSVGLCCVGFCVSLSETIDLLGFWRTRE